MMSIEEYTELFDKLRDKGCQHIVKHFPTGKVVMTNGCFDILHRGHIECLEYARGQGDFLIVAVNDDDGIRQLKGDSRPINRLEDRMYVLKSLECVDMVVAFHGTRATEIFKMIRPDIYVKGGDYTIDTLDKGERDALMAWKPQPEFKFFKFQTNISTTGIIERMKK